MGELIDRQAALDALGEGAMVNYQAAGHNNGLIKASDVIKGLPSAQPEIIRCRDCKHWDKTWTNDWSPDYHYCPMIDGVCKGDFYCADAERRTDG